MLCGTVDLKRGEIIPVDLIYYQMLRAEVILVLVAEERRRESGRDSK